MANFKIETMTFHNPTDHMIKLDAIGLDPVPPKSDAEIPLTLAAPTRKDNGTRGKSALEQVAPQLHPKNSKDHDAWKQTPEPVVPKSKIVAVTARPANEAPGVKTLRDLKALAEAEKSSGSPQDNVSTTATK